MHLCDSVPAAHIVLHSPRHSRLRPNSSTAAKATCMHAAALQAFANDSSAQCEPLSTHWTMHQAQSWLGQNCVPAISSLTSHQTPSYIMCMPRGGMLGRCGPHRTVAPHSHHTDHHSQGHVQQATRIMSHMVASGITCKCALYSSTRLILCCLLQPPTSFVHAMMPLLAWCAYTADHDQ